MTNIWQKSVNCPDKYLNATVPAMKCKQTEIRRSRQTFDCRVLKAISLKLCHSQECLSSVFAQNFPLVLPHFPSLKHFLFCHIKQDQSHMISGKWEVISQQPLCMLVSGLECYCSVSGYMVQKVFTWSCAFLYPFRINCSNWRVPTHWTNECTKNCKKIEIR